VIAMTSLILLGCVIACPLVMGAMMLLMRARRGDGDERGGD
jgi:hypothetical protein